jgi:hypothetical protein
LLEEKGSSFASTCILVCNTTNDKIQECESGEAVIAEDTEAKELGGHGEVILAERTLWE